VRDLARLIREFEAVAGELDREIELEEDRTRTAASCHIPHTPNRPPSVAITSGLPSDAQAAWEAIRERDEAISAAYSDRRLRLWRCKRTGRDGLIIAHGREGSGHNSEPRTCSRPVRSHPAVLRGPRLNLEVSRHDGGFKKS
jgi:hypothetical protein